MRRTKVLVVDDKRNVLGLFAKILATDFELEVATNALHALERIAGRGPFDVVVTDLRMPGADGVDLLRAIKGIAPATQVILMTAYGSPEVRSAALREGAFAILPKPFDPDDARDLIARSAEASRESGVRSPHRYQPA